MPLVPLPTDRKRKQQAQDPSLIAKITGNVLSPLAKAANTLDVATGASSLRDALAGENPFDQFTTKWWEDSGNRTSGRDLLRKHGMVGNQDTWGNAIAGFGAELLLDPGTYLTGGLGGLGKAMQGTGKATHLFKLGLPMSHKGVEIGKTAARSIDKMAAKAWGSKFGKQAELAGNALFHPYAKGKMNPLEQRFNIDSGEAAERAGVAGFKESMNSLNALKTPHQRFVKEYAHLPNADETFERIFRRSRENFRGTMTHGDAFDEAIQHYTGKGASPELRSEMESALGITHDTDRMLRDEAALRGVKVGQTDSDKIGYFPRSGDEDYLASKKRSATGEGLLSHSGTRHRERVIANFTSDDLEHMLANRKDYSGKAGAARILAEFGSAGKKQLGYTSTKGLVIDEAKHAAALAKKIGKADPKITKFHQFAPMGLQKKNIESFHRVISNADSIHDALVNAPKKGGITAAKAYKALGMDPQASIAWIAKKLGVTEKQARKFRFDPELVEAIQKSSEAIKSGPWREFIAKHVDQFNRMFKSGVTLPFPGFHIRNWISGQHMNLASKHLKTGRDYMDYAKSYAEAMSLRNADDAHPLIQEAMAHKVLDPYTATEDVQLPGANKLNAPVIGVKDAYQQAQKWVKENPEGTWVGGLDQYLPNKVREVMNTPMQMGANAARATEFMNRMPMYLYLRKKGLAPGEAAAEVSRLQFDYSRASPLERSYLKRLFPFYTFNKSITKQVAQMLLDEPGGKVAQTIRASNKGRDEGSIMPTHIANTAAVNMGNLKDGTQKYLTGFGLAPEAALPYLTGPLGGTDDALREAASATTPLFKFPMERVSGQTFFQRGLEGGRSLKELDPTLSRIAANVTGNEDIVAATKRSPERMLLEHVAANTPFSKLATTARTATDKRKWEGHSIAGMPDAVTNILSPLKITDVSPQTQERLLQQASNALADELGARKWSNRYFKAEDIAQAERANPLIAAQMKALNAMWKESKKAAAKHRSPKKKSAQRAG